MTDAHPPERPAEGGPEQLSPDPAPTATDGPDGGRRGGRRRVVVGGAAVAVVALLGGGAWAATSFFTTGAQPSEAVPADALAYVSIDLDPDGAQKIEALRTLRKFPAFREEVGLETGDDLRRELVESIAEDSGCEVDYARDVEPWIGERTAVAVLPGEQPTEPVPVGVLQVTDADAAAEGIEALAACGEGSGEGGGESGFAIEGDWAVVAESQEVAQQVLDDAAEASLADDADFTRWGEQLGDPGVVTMYAAPAAGDAILAGLESAAAQPGDSAEYSAEELSPLSPFGGVPGLGGAFGPGGELPEEARRQLEDFEGAAGTLRFDDGGLELALAVDASERTVEMAETQGSLEAATSLPADTAAVLGVAMPEGWASATFDRLEASLGPVSQEFFGMPFDDLVAMAEEQSGLALPEDAEALLGESFAIALGGDFSVSEAEASPDGSDVPVGAKIVGDADEVQRVLDALDAAFGIGSVVGDDAEGDAVAVGPDADYRAELLGDGGLGESERFDDVVEEADDAFGLLYADFDAQWIDELVSSEGDAEVAENVEPLSALGMSTWLDDGAVRVSIQLTTD